MAGTAIVGNDHRRRFCGWHSGGARLLCEEPTREIWGGKVGGPPPTKSKERPRSGLHGATLAKVTRKKEGPELRIQSQKGFYCIRIAALQSF